MKKRSNRPKNSQFERFFMKFSCFFELVLVQVQGVFGDEGA